MTTGFQSESNHDSQPVGSMGQLSMGQSWIGRFDSGGMPAQAQTPRMVWLPAESTLLCGVNPI